MTTGPATIYGRATCPPLAETKKRVEQGGADLLYLDVDDDPPAVEGPTELERVTALPVVVTPDLQ